MWLWLCIKSVHKFAISQFSWNPSIFLKCTERQYGLVTSYTETKDARMWHLKATPTENPCISADWTVLRPPPYPHPTLPPIPTALVTGEHGILSTTESNIKSKIKIKIVGADAGSGDSWWSLHHPCLLYCFNLSNDILIHHGSMEELYTLRASV